MSTEITSKRDTGKDGEVKQQYINTMCTYIRLLRFECVVDISAGEFYFKYFWAKRYNTARNEKNTDPYFFLNSLSLYTDFRILS